MEPGRGVRGRAGAAVLTGTAGRPATYRGLLAAREPRALFASLAVSVTGDMVTAVAVTVLVLERTGSTTAAAAGFALAYLPWVVGGPLLATIADRLPRRRTLVLCDLGRAALIGAMTVPALPVPVLLLLLLGSAMLAPPSQASRSALLPAALPGDYLVLGLSVQATLRQSGNVAGLVIGGIVVNVATPRGALALDAVTFLLSAALLRFGVADRPAPPVLAGRALLRDTASGVRVVMGDVRLRSIVLLVWLTAAAVFASEGLAAPYARHLVGADADGARTPAVTTGLLLAAIPFGQVVGSIVVARTWSGPTRDRYSPWLLAGSAAVLTSLVADPPLPVVLAVYAAAGFGLGGQAALNARYVRAVEERFRARAYGVAQSGLQVSQGVAVLTAGMLAGVLAPPTVVALYGGAGAVGIIAVLALSAGAWDAPPAGKAADGTGDGPRAAG